jgi:hypothetical protein
MNDGKSMMRFDQSTYAAEKVGGYVPVVKQGGNVRIPLSEIAKQSDVDAIQAEIGNVETLLAAL